MNVNLLTGIAMTLLISCVDRDRHGNILDTPTSGSITIIADEALKPLVDAEIHAFEGIYRQAHVAVHYASEEDAIDSLLKGSARLAIVTRLLGADEESQLQDQTIVPQQISFATGGIALITNRENPDSLISLQELSQLLGGELGRNKGLQKNFTQLVFDQPNSGVIRYLRDSLISFDRLPDYCFALKSNSAVVQHVSENPQVLGLIDVSWISDRDDSTANSFLRSIRVMSVSGDSNFFQPYQAYLAQRKYPLVRNVTMISREARSGLASGFMAFVASERGQRIVLKSGLVPATMPIRIIEINHEPF